MSILNVENVTHGFGGRSILEDASFRLLKGEHIGLVGANGEGKSTFLNIITGKITPDSGKVEWCKHITTGYLDQYSTLEKGKTIRDVLRDAFSELTKLETEMLLMYDKMGDASEEEINKCGRKETNADETFQSCKVCRGKCRKVLSLPIHHVLSFH